MVLRTIRLALSACGASALVLLALCLGAQNLDERVSLNLGLGRSTELPTGFVVGIALVAGLFSGGMGAALVLSGGSDRGV
ncbi:hypothetical protein EVJ50_14115 [Synechococcus sp. RSCCF101]|uniref:hypothetical protein n=1 Tax=Synechococcus sp. RSCCF101 TaxID=2511069 RepID=UPI001246D21B|nr:hypothetical protein [Synechococcus sp. RSCCF101]QEY33200.1 hypothetical protein EVJ50_14115 [Synechococcus sp. RSCCF101]